MSETNWEWLILKSVNKRYPKDGNIREFELNWVDEMDGTVAQSWAKCNLITIYDLRLKCNCVIDYTLFAVIVNLGSSSPFC